MYLAASVYVRVCVRVCVRACVYVFKNLSKLFYFQLSLAIYLTLSSAQRNPNNYIYQFYNYIIIIIIIIYGNLYSALFILGFTKALYTENNDNCIKHVNTVHIPVIQVNQPAERLNIAITCLNINPKH